MEDLVESVGGMAVLLSILVGRGVLRESSHWLAGDGSVQWLSGRVSKSLHIATWFLQHRTLV